MGPRLGPFLSDPLGSRSEVGVALFFRFGRRRGDGAVPLEHPVGADQHAKGSFFVRRGLPVDQLHLKRKGSLSDASLSPRPFSSFLFPTHLIRGAPLSKAGNLARARPVAPSPPVGQRVAKLLPKPGVVVGHVRVGQNVVGQRTAQVVLAREMEG